ncbi:DUF4105 domain-containing protein [Prolixibacteraceae bacterium]|nr:DUF4105 domain-containing protein [Prolixibacteraceae bacterium]
MNKHIKTLFFTLLIICFGSRVQASSESTFYLITCEPGDEIYSLFGHSALRYEDKQNNLDIVFNYGLFNFDTPNFLWKFVLGETDYLLGYSEYERFTNAYSKNGRAVYQDTLRLTKKEKDILFKNLRINLKRENRIYRYNYLRNNCSTKLEEQVSKAVGKIKWKHEGASTYTFRDLLDQYMNYYSWDAVGIYLALGAPCDEVATWKETLFLPEYLQSGFIHAKRSSEKTIVLGNTQVVVKKNTSHQSGKSNPIYIFILLLGVTILLFVLKNKYHTAVSIGLKIFWLTNALAGIILCFLCFISVHPLTGYNMNILVFCPINLVLIFLKTKGSKYIHFKMRVLKLYMFSLIIFTITTLVFGIQKIHTVIYIVTAAYALLAYLEYRINKI